MLKKLGKNRKRIYMDYASSTPINQCVRRFMKIYQSTFFANPSSLYKEGVAARDVINKSREDIADILGVHSNEIIFTSGGTEGDNMAILGVVNASLQEVSVGPRTVRVGPRSRKGKPHVVIANIEHSAVRETCRSLKKEGTIDVTEIPVEANGIVNPDLIKKALKENTVLVSVMYANNEIGTIQPIREISKVIRHFRKNRRIHKQKNTEAGAKMAEPFLHTDAAQAVNYLPMKIEKLGVDLLTFNGSKIYGPRGIGVLFKKRGVPLSPIFHGGNQEFGFRPGTEHVAATLGIAEALRITEEIKEKESKRLIGLRDYFFKEIDKLNYGIIINGDRENRLPNNVNISIPDMESELLVLQLDAKGIAVSSKSACKNDEEDESYVIQALREGYKKKEGRALSKPRPTGRLQSFGRALVKEGTIRFSLGRETTRKDIDYTLKALQYILTKLSRWKT